MRKIGYIIGLLTLIKSAGFGQNSSISIDLSYCNEKIVFINNPIKLFIYKDDSLISQIITNSTYNVHYDNLLEGYYQIVFFKRNNKKIKRRINVINDSNYSISICYEKIQKYKNENYSLIKSLTNGDSLIFNYYTIGCFHSYEEEFIVFQHKDELYLIFDSVTSKLSVQQIESLKNFENSLLTFRNEGFCTTESNYSISHKKKIINIHDSGCSWMGYYNLRDSLKLEKEKK